MFISLFRAIKFSLQDVVRNIWLSIVTVTIFVLALITVNMLLVVSVISDATIGAIKDKIDINLYIGENATENEILALKAKITQLPQAKDVLYISKTQALTNFREKYKNDPEILQALRELGKNPLNAALIVKPKEAESFESLLAGIDQLDSGIIESQNFEDHEAILGKINSISEKVNLAGLAVSAIFLSITILMVYNSIRMAIYTHRMEINIMRLVGASNGFIKAPYLISGVIYALLGTLIAIICFFPFLSLLQPYLETFFIGYNVNVFSYFAENSLKIFGAQFGAMAFLNIFTGYIAVSKYSKV